MIKDAHGKIVLEPEGCMTVPLPDEVVMIDENRNEYYHEGIDALFLSLNHFQIRSQFDSLFIARASARALSNRTPGWYGPVP